jgi:hypothetical protein
MFLLIFFEYDVIDFFLFRVCCVLLNVWTFCFCGVSVPGFDVDSLVKLGVVFSIPPKTVDIAP